MKWTIFFGYITVSFLIMNFVFGPSHLYMNEILGKADQSILQDTLTLYYEIYKTPSKDTFKQLVKIIDMLLATMKNLCYLYKANHGDIVISFSECVTTNPCHIKQNLEKLLASLKSSLDEKRLLKEIQQAYDSVFFCDNYLTLALDMAVNEMNSSARSKPNIYLDHEAYNEAIEDTEGISDLQKLVVNTIGQLMNNANYFSTCIEQMGESAIEGIGDVQKKLDINQEGFQELMGTELEDILQKFTNTMDDSIKVVVQQLMNIRKSTNLSILRLITFFCINNSWMKFMNAMVEIHMFFILWNILALIVFYRYPAIPLTLAYGSQFVFAIMFIKIKGCVCKIKDRLWTFDLLDKYAEEQRQLELRLRRFRRRRRN